MTSSLAQVSAATTESGFLLIFAIFVPVAGMIAAFLTGGRNAGRIALATLPAGLAIAIALALVKAKTAEPVVYLVGGWAPPLGVALRADGLSAVMILMTAVVVLGIGVYAAFDFCKPEDKAEARAPFSFWILLLAIWSGLNLVFVASDMFTLYVALELLTFAAVPLVCLDGRAETFQAALRYLLFALLGSVLYLAGTILIYGAYGTLDIALLSIRVRAEPVTIMAAALMTVGLLAKTALFPLHLWLPPAHASAPPAASAMLSGLVVKGPFFIVVRLFFDVMPNLAAPAAMMLLGGLGAAGIVFGSILALRQVRLKLLIAYSTLAQIGFLFLLFPLSAGGSRGALAGGMIQATSHATAKAAMFMAAGLIYKALGHDRIAGLAGAARLVPIAVLAFATGGVALMGVPTSGAYLAKDLLLQASGETGAWWWGAAVQAGGIFTAAYLFFVLANALARPFEALKAVALPRGQQIAALSLAICSLMLGLFPWSTYLPLPGQSAVSFSFDALMKIGITALAGSALALLAARWDGSLVKLPLTQSFVQVLKPLRRSGVAVGKQFEIIGLQTARFSIAGIFVLVLTALLGGALAAR